MCQKSSFNANSASRSVCPPRQMCADSKQSYLETDKNSAAFLTQLSMLGLELRDIEGDGNCLFRALGDQLEGSGEHHREYRERVCDYMAGHRADFEPFVALETVTFPDYVAGLRRAGSYAGNDAIVAFGRLFELDIVIHQLGRPPIAIKCDGTETHILTAAGVSKSDVGDGNVKGQQSAAADSQVSQCSVRELHISYHNNEHYASVRLKGDSSPSPTNFHHSTIYNHNCTVTTVTADNTNTSSSSSSYSNNSNNNITTIKRLHQDNYDDSLSSNISSFHNHYNNKRPRLE